MKVGFIFGRQPALSYAEWEAIFNSEGETLNRFPPSDASPFQGTSGRGVNPRPSAKFIVETFPGAVFWEGSVAAARAAFDRCGGSIKAVEVMAKHPIQGGIASTLESLLQPDLITNAQPDPKRIRFGFSLYPLDGKVAPFRLMKHVQKIGIALRKSMPRAKFLTSKDPTLSSVIVTKEHLIDRGTEWCIFFDASRVILARTIGVQAFQSFSERDYGRPERDDRSGMLPPKLSRMMIHLAAVPTSASLLDPHCGSGTVLQEALLLGFQRVLGSDLEPAAVRATQRNLDWLRQRLPHLPGANVKQGDVRNLAQIFPKTTIDAIVTEPYLGPSRFSERKNLDTVIKKLTDLYRETFASYKSILSSKGRIVSIFPVFVQDNNHRFLPIIETIERSGFSLQRFHLPPIYPTTSLAARRAERGTLLYGRPGQYVLREITVWIKN